MKKKKQQNQIRYTIPWYWIGSAVNMRLVASQLSTTFSWCDLRLCVLHLKMTVWSTSVVCFVCLCICNNLLRLYLIFGSKLATTLTSLADDEA